MAMRHITLAILLLGGATSASAAVTVLGTSAARSCYEAADAGTYPTREAMERCNTALAEESLAPYEIVATHVNRGILRLRSGNVDLAVADFDTAIALDPNQPEAYLNKGSAMIRRNDPNTAAQLFTMAIEHNTRRPEIAHYGRAVANEALGDVRAAYLDYRRASELAPAWREPRLELQRFRVVSR